MKNLTLLTILSFLFLSNFNIAAQSKSEKDTNLKWFLRFRIAETDLNKNQKVDKAEIKADKSGYWAYYRKQANFMMADKDKSGDLDFNELKALRYREEGAILQQQANEYDVFVEEHGEEKLSDIAWLKKNKDVANVVMSNHEWLSKYQGKFNGLTKSNWLGQNKELLNNIASNYFLIIRQNNMGRMINSRFPKSSNRFVKEFSSYRNSISRLNNKKGSDNELSRPSKSDVKKAQNAPKRKF